MAPRCISTAELSKTRPSTHLYRGDQSRRCTPGGGQLATGLQALAAEQAVQMSHLWSPSRPAAACSAACAHAKSEAREARVASCRSNRMGHASAVRWLLCAQPHGVVGPKGTAGCQVTIMNPWRDTLTSLWRPQHHTPCNVWVTWVAGYSLQARSTDAARSLAASESLACARRPRQEFDSSDSFSPGATSRVATARL